MGKQQKRRGRPGLTISADGVHLWFADDAEAYRFAYDLNEAARGMREHDVFHTESVQGCGMRLAEPISRA